MKAKKISRRKKTDNGPECKSIAYNFGKKFHLKVYKNGFSLWDSKEGRWIIDASGIKEDDSFTINPGAKISNPRAYGGGPEYNANLKGA